MAILIPDIEMPKSCSDCPCCYDYIYCTALSKGLVRDDDGNYYSELGIDIFETRFPDCPLKEVPNINNHTVGEVVAYGDMVTLAKIMPKHDCICNNCLFAKKHPEEHAISCNITGAYIPEDHWCSFWKSSEFWESIYEQEKQETLERWKREMLDRICKVNLPINVIMPRKKGCK